MCYCESKTDEVTSMHCFLLLKYMCILLSNEIKTSANLDAAIIKKLSGGDKMTGRLHCGNKTPFNPHFLPIIVANDLPTIKPYCDATDTRVHVINYEKVFVDNPSNQFEAQKDGNLKDEMKTEDFQHVFVMLFIQTYKKIINNGPVEYEPPRVTDAKELWIGSAGENLMNFVSKYL